ncbi:hypothetical protein [uncultured Lamprocystis sp.]|jgi:hypothetical protein|uniref:hypothetical protein n=1 Tax=uncultured Lamprocystis sp. TaxID=543132 RepID=UPI0025E0F65B|nr:hypothetical protein [uncultured Lamprocystis sp.]
MELAKHAADRQKQRGISPLIIDWLIKFGASETAGRGAEILYFDKKSRRDLRKAFGKQVVDRLSELLDAYAVIADDRIVTLGHRYKRIHNT